MPPPPCIVAKTYCSRAQVKVRLGCVDSTVYCVDSTVYCVHIVVYSVFKFLHTGWTRISSKLQRDCGSAENLNDVKPPTH